MHGGTHRGQKGESPDDCRSRLGDLERPELQFAHARHQWHVGPERPQEAAQKDRPGAEAVNVVLVFFFLGFVFVERPDVQDLVVIMESDPIGNPVAHHRTRNRAGPCRYDADVTGADHRAQRDQEKGTGDDERNAHEGFGKRHQKGDRKTPFRMGLRDARDPRRQVTEKPMGKLVEHAFFAFIFCNKPGFATNRNEAGTYSAPASVARGGDIFD